MKIQSLKAISLAFVSIVLINFSCQKKVEDSLPPNEYLSTLESVVSESKAFFSNQIVGKEKEMLALPFSALPEKSPQRIFARMGKLQNKLNWEKAVLFENASLWSLIIPISDSVFLHNNNSIITRNIVFYKNWYDEIHFNIIEIITKDNIQPDIKDQVVKIAFINKILGKSEKIPEINANIFFYDEKYESKASFEIRNGSIYATTSQIRPKLIEVTSNNVNPTVGSVSGESCEPWGVFWNYYENGVLVWSELLYTYNVCDGVNTQDEYGSGGSGGGTSGGGGDASFTDEDGDEFRIRTGTSVKVVYTIDPIVGGGFCKTTQQLFARLYTIRSDKDKITGCTFVRSDVTSNSLGANSTIGTYNVSNLHTSTVNVAVTGTINYPGSPSNTFSNSISISLGDVGWYL